MRGLYSYLQCRGDFASKTQCAMYLVSKNGSVIAVQSYFSFFSSFEGKVNGDVYFEKVRDSKKLNFVERMQCQF